MALTQLKQVTIPTGTPDMSNYYTKTEADNRFAEKGSGGSGDYLTRSQADQLYEPKSTTGSNALLKAFPVGSVVMNTTGTNPSTYIGGNWVRTMVNRFPIGAGSSYSADSTGGSTTHTLTVDEMPTHRHSLGTVKVTSSNTGNNTTVSAGNGSGSTPLSKDTSEVGGGQSFSIMPPYQAVYFWERTS